MTGGNSPWRSAAWAESSNLTRAGYPANSPYSSTPAWPLPQNPQWQGATNPAPMGWGSYSPASGTPMAFSPYGATPMPASGYPAWTTPQPQYYPSPLGRSTSLSAHNSPYLGSSSPYGLQRASSPYGIKRSSSVGPLDHRLARRPREWREDYSPRTGISAILPIRRSLSFARDEEYHDDIKRALHPFLQYNIFNPPVFLDLRDDPMTIKFHHLGRPFNQYDLLQYACEPPADFIRLYHDKLPWYIDICARNPSGVTIHDLFDQLHDALMVQIRNKDFYNEELDNEDRAKVSNAFRERCGGNQAEIALGVRRIDFLRGRIVFEGLTRGKHGMWEIRARKR
jgi:hypothetical protein